MELFCMSLHMTERKEERKKDDFAYARKKERKKQRKERQTERKGLTDRKKD